MLPFVNLSSDKDQEFFSDGITEEITSALAKIPRLTVIGRTSAFQYKGENKDLRAIGQALGVKNLIEGSVRKAGNQVRITAELIKVADGTQIWTDSYDRKLTDIFAIQEDIATAIAGSLQVPLGLKPGETLVTDRTADTDLYQDYLRARALLNARKTSETIATLQWPSSHAIPAMRPPGRCWRALTQVCLPSLRLTTSFGPGPSTRRAGLHNPNMTKWRRRRAPPFAWIREARAPMPRWPVLNRTMEIGSPLRVTCAKPWRLIPTIRAFCTVTGLTWRRIGHLKEALRLQNQIMALEPFVPVYRSRYADLLWAMGQNDAAIKIWEAMPADGTNNIRLAKAYATAGRYAKGRRYDSRHFPHARLSPPVPGGRGAAAPDPRPPKSATRLPFRFCPGS